MKRMVVVTLALGLGLGLGLGDGGVAVAQGRRVKLKVPPLPPSTEDLLVASPEKAPWVPAERVGLPRGAEVALIGADPVSTGETSYLKAPAGWHLPSHWHVHNEYLTLVSGHALLVLSGRRHPLVPGSFVVIPSKARHELTCAPGAACLMIVRRSGPADLHWVGAAK